MATHCTGADVSIQHFGLAREICLETVGFLMMAHTIPPEKLAAQARIIADAGCQCVYVVDSAGALVLGACRPGVGDCATGVADCVVAYRAFNERSGMRFGQVQTRLTENADPTGG